MNYKILPNGHLLLTAGNSDRSYLAEENRRGYCHAESLIAECYHEQLYFVAPESIAALTGAPILCDDMEFPDNGDFRPHVDAHVWWFPDYCIRDPWGELARFGRVRFTKAES